MTEAIVPASILAIQDKPLSSYTRDDINLAKSFLNCPTASDQLWQKMCILSKQYDLNPLLSEIWILPSVGVFVGLNGLLKVAIRSGQYDGIRAECYDIDGKIWNGEGHPAWAECTVWRKDSKRDYFQRVYWNEFNKAPMYPSKGGKNTWEKFPGYMLEKVAKSHALKLAFSLDELYIPEEFGHIDKTDETYADVIDITPEPEPVIVKEPAKPAAEPVTPQAPSKQTKPTTAEPDDINPDDYYIGSADNVPGLTREQKDAYNKEYAEIWDIFTLKNLPLNLFDKYQRQSEKYGTVYEKKGIITEAKRYALINGIKLTL